MSPRTKRYRGHYGFKDEAEFLKYCWQQVAAGKTVTTTELKMLLEIITGMGGALNLLTTKEKRT